MLRACRSRLLLALACIAVVTTGASVAPAAAQVPVASITDQLRMQTLHEALQVQRADVLRGSFHRSGGAASPDVPLTPLRLAALQDSLAHYDLLQRRSRGASRALLTLGAVALGSGLFDAATSDARLLSGRQRSLILGGFGLTILGADQWKAASGAQARLDGWRAATLAAGPPHF